MHERESPKATVLAITLAIAGLIVLFFGLLSYRQEIYLRSHGVRVSGHVVRNELRRTREPHEEESHWRHYLWMTFPEGTPIPPRWVHVSAGDARKYPVGSQPEVVYDPDNPKLMELVAGLGSTPIIALIAGIVVICGSIGSLIWDRKLRAGENTPEAPSLDDAIQRAKR